MINEIDNIISMVYKKITFLTQEVVQLLSCSLTYCNFNLSYLGGDDGSPC